jgi:two-component system, response regulator PdtaR
MPSQDGEKTAIDSVQTILVAEDEVLIRHDTSDYLRTHGYDVIEANSATEAIQVLNSPATIALVFTDVRMPGTIDGIDLARYVRNHHPEIPVLITSGHILASELSESAGPFFSKPYDLAIVLRAIGEEILKATNNSGSNQWSDQQWRSWAKNMVAVMTAFVAWNNDTAVPCYV